MYSETFTTFKETLVIAYYYIINADGIIDPREVSFGETMIQKEEIEESDFHTKLEELKAFDHEHLKNLLRNMIQELEVDDQVKIIAYMSKIADADGYRDPAEMHSIQDIYNNLHVHLNDIIRVKETIEIQ